MIRQIVAYFDEKEAIEVNKVLKDEWITEGTKTDLFENMFSKYTKIKNSIAVNNGTSGLYMCLKI